jgi:hypothetical protein
MAGGLRAEEHGALPQKTKKMLRALISLELWDAVFGQCHFSAGEHSQAAHNAQNEDSG